MTQDEEEKESQSAFDNLCKLLKLLTSVKKRIDFNLIILFLQSIVLFLSFSLVNIF